MELLPFLRWCWDRRLVIVGALVAAVAAFVVLGSSRSSGTTSAVAWTQVTLETPRSELAAAAPAGASTLAWRASLVAHLMSTDASTRQLANRAGVTPNELAVVDPSLLAPVVQTSMAVATAQASLVAAPYMVEVFLPDPTLPLISIEARAPQAAGAKRLAAAAVAGLNSQASRGGSFSSPIPTDANPLGRSLQPFVMDQVAPVRVMLFPGSTLSLKAIAGALAVFVLCCLIGGRLRALTRARLRPRRSALA